MTDTSVKPCPFCGEAPDSQAIEDGHWAIDCSNENCHAYPIVVIGKTREIATKRWNTRPETETEKR